MADTPMKYPKLRIAWSMTWGVVAILLCVLWVRSYWRFIGAHGTIGGRCFIVETERGESKLNVLPGTINPTWYSVPLDVVDAERQRTRVEDGQNPRNTSGGFGLLWWTYRAGFGGKVSLHHPIAISAALAIIPWLRQFTWRFSLRTLLIATTLVAMALGATVWFTHR